MMLVLSKVSFTVIIKVDILIFP